ncbi:MAG TPA: phosphoesterase [Candidatus Micrarchaeia archaeon]|nr:phosphoesterase [Candidatus Micrarchaeia archaeon]
MAETPLAGTPVAALAPAPGPSRPLVCYHGDCPDGFGAAYAAWKRWGDGADYRPISHGDSPPEVGGRTVLICDFAFSRPVTERLWAEAADLRVLDHHRSAAAELHDLDCCTFDMDRSGAVMTWEHLHGSPPPPLLRYVQDRDLWRNQLPGSAEVSVALSAHPYDFAVWDALDVDLLRREGAVLLRYQRQLVDRIAARAAVVEVAGIPVPVVNSPILQSELGDRLAQGRPFAGVWWQGGDGLARWSLRSTPAGIDVSAIAVGFGGGGHRNAAGFRGAPPTAPEPPPPLPEAPPRAPAAVAALAGASETTPP